MECGMVGANAHDPSPATSFRRGSSEVERWSHKPLVGGSIPSCGTNIGGLAQMGERLICIQEVNGSIPLFSTNIDPLG